MNGNEYRLEFLKRQVLGRSVDLRESESVIKRCIELADKDMLAGGRFISARFEIKTRKKRVDFLFKKLERVKYQYKEIDKEVLCEEVFWECDKSKHIMVKGHRREFKSFGFAQKLINMTFKYMYIFKEEIERVTGETIKFCECDCPLDRTILETLNGDVKWTQMKLEEYNDKQEEIDEKLKDDKYAGLKEELGRLAYDMHWSNKD